MAYTHGYDPADNRIEAQNAASPAASKPTSNDEQTELLRLILAELRMLNRDRRMDAMRERLGARAVGRRISN